MAKQAGTPTADHPLAHFPTQMTAHRQAPPSAIANGGRPLTSIRVGNAAAHHFFLKKE